MAKELVPAGDPLAGYLITQMDASFGAQALAANFAGEELDRHRLPKIKVPTGGSAAWTLITDDGPEPVKAFPGVILWHGMQRAFWPDKFGAGGSTGTPPACSSHDNIRGIGNPGVICKRCDHAKYGTAKRDDGSAGRGQACRQIRVMMLLRPDSMVPTVLAVPPTSLGSISDYLMYIAGKGRPFWTVETSFGLGVDNSSGMPVSVVRPTIGKLLPVETVNRLINPMREAISGLMQTLDAADFAEAA